MKRGALIVPLFAVVVALAAKFASSAIWHDTATQHIDLTSQNIGHFKAVEQEAAGLCPWRNPEADMAAFFPGSSRYEETLLVVSNRRMRVQELLGRAPTGDENSLRAYRIYAANKPVGLIVPRRMAGEHGLIEFTIAISYQTDTITGASIQRMREPEPIQQALTAPAWLTRFQGANVSTNWHDVAESVPNHSALPSAESICSAVKVVMALYDASGQQAGVHK